MFRHAAGHLAESEAGTIARGTNLSGQAEGGVDILAVHAS